MSWSIHDPNTKMRFTTNFPQLSRKNTKTRYTRTIWNRRATYNATFTEKPWKYNDLVQYRFITMVAPTWNTQVFKINHEDMVTGKKKKNSSGFKKRCVQTLRPISNFLPSKNIHQRSIYLRSGWIIAFWLCTGSGKRTDGNNLWLSFKSRRLLFLFSWFPLVPKMSFWSRVPAC